MYMNNSDNITILIDILHGLGDTVCALPMLTMVRKAFPDAYIVVLTKSKAGSDIIKASKIKIDEIHEFNIYKNLGYSIQFLRELRARHFTYGISSCITPVRKARFFMGFIHPKHWIGWQRRGLYFDLLKDKYHFVDANLLSVKDLCPKPLGKNYPRLYAEKVDIEAVNQISRVENTNKKLVGVCIGNADYSLKNRFLRTGKVYTRGWGIENMTSLVQLLIKSRNHIALIGGKEEESLLPYLMQKVGQTDLIHNFVGKTNIRQSIALVSLCDCVFGVDTGMQHIAAAVGTPTLSIFGPTNPKTHGAYAPNAEFITNSDACKLQYCYGTKNYVNCPNRRICLYSITPQEVYEKILGILSK